ncbi:hypothetical protein [Flavobacterium sp.]|jgi:hypothetical protein|uniref:hypothetical protein n=1 Tax=Flavobacterium sp. TaxID=239 RepID=UPI004047B806
MKKNLLLAAFFATTLTFATNVKKNDSQENNFAVEKKISESNVSEDETVGCAWTTINYFYRTYTRRVLSMYTDEVAYETVTVLSNVCTTCYQMGNSGVTSSTTCIN